MIEILFPLMLFFLLFIFILLGVPVAFALSGSAIIVGVIASFFDVFYLSDFSFIPQKIYGIMQNFTLLAVPLFVFMGYTLEVCKIAEDLIYTFEKAFRRIKGGLLIAIIIVGALLAASTGIVGATVVTMGILALPAMVSKGYDKSLAAGTIATAGTLGQIIPPSIVLILLADMTNVAVADLFAGATIPGLILVLLYIIYVIIRIKLNPSLAPALPIEKISFLEILTSLLPPLLLILIVLGSILFGIASPTESAGCGALGAIILAGFKKRLNLTNLIAILEKTVMITSFVFMLLIGAQIFSIVFRGMYGDVLIEDFISQLHFSKGIILFIIMTVIFFLGFFLDFIEITFIIVPIIIPVLVNNLHFNPLWLAILIAINLQTSFLTPPFGFALFYLKGVSPPEVKTTHIYKGVLPFIFLQILALIIVWIFPKTATFLPSVLF